MPKRKKNSPQQREKIYKYDLKLVNGSSEWKKMSSAEKENYLRKFRSLDRGTGWNPLEAALFFLVLKKYGCGNWETMSYFLPHQNTAQFNTFCQKLFGQQSTYAFSGLRVDPYEAYLEGSHKTGLRKSGVRVHEGVPLCTSKKKEVKQSWAKRQRTCLYDLPIVEDRSRNYTKLWWQMETQMHLIRSEARRRGIEDEIIGQDLGPETIKKIDHTKWMDKPYAWPKPTKWNLDAEIETTKGQDNPFPLIRLVEDEDWYKTDQALHWAFIEGKIFKDKEFSKQFKPNDIVDTSLAGVDPAKLRARCKVKKSKETYEMEVEAENQQLETDPEAFGCVASWSPEQLAQYLRENDMPSTVVSKLEELRVDGRKSFVLAMNEAEKVFGDNRSALDKYDSLMMRASRKYGFERR